MNIEREGINAIVTNNNMVYSYEIAQTPRDFRERRQEDSLNWAERDYFVGGYRIHPYGDNNDLPTIIRDVVKQNADAPGIMKKKTQLLWGKGPKLYREVFDKDNQLIKKWIDDKEVINWLNTWDYEDFITKCAVDFAHIEGTFTKFYNARGSRLGNNFIAKLEHCTPDKARLASEYNQYKINIPTHVIITDFDFNNISSIDEMKVYALFERTNPFKYATTMYYSNMYSFCQDYYTVPDIYGTLEWIRRSTAGPLILKAFAKNSMNIKYHVISPQLFWDQKENELKKNCEERGVVYNTNMLREYENNLLQDVAKVLSGESNAGKYWHTKKAIEVQGTNLIEHGWEIKVIDQKIKEFIESQILISDHSSRKVSTSIGVHSALGNVGGNGTADSGSEQLYALQNFLATGIDIPEMIVMKPINMALKINFPDKDLKIGFYHTNAKREQDVTPSKRTINQTT